MSWRGFHPIWGIWFPPGWQQPERLLAAWQPGARLFSAWQGWLLVYASPRFGAAESCPGMAVVKVEEGWSSHPSLRPGAGQLALRWHGEEWRGDMQPLDPADLWDWQSLQYEAAHKPELVPARPLLAPTAPSLSIGAILPSIPPPAPERDQLLEKLSKPAETSKNPLLGLFDLLRSVFGSPENERYMNKMLQLFEQKNWREALRHAIPIGDSRSPAWQEFIGQLKPRAGLDFTSPIDPSSSLGTSLQGFELLQALYRRALEGLLESGRIEEAAYVLGELLADYAGAVDLLEKHGRIEEAARLATLKGMPASLQVRLWFQAGRSEVALAMARRYGVQAEALQMLARKDPELANRFRAAWATDLADAGCTSQAITVGWPVREQLEDYEFWLRSGLDSAGPGSLEALVYGLQDLGYCERLQLPERLQAFFQDRDLLTQPRRRLILERLAGSWFETRHPLLQSWATDTARRVMRQANSPVPLGDQRILEFLIHLSGDPWLRADRPAKLGETAARLGLWSETILQQGLTPIHDALWLGDGRILLALGQAGMVVLSRGGKISQRFALPAYQLVDGERPILVSGPNLSRFEGGKANFWCQASLDGWCESHDGYHWVVWLGRQIYTIDLLSQEWRGLAQLTLDSPPREIQVCDQTALVDTGSRLHLLRVPQLEVIRAEEMDPGPNLCTPTGVETLSRLGELWKFRGQTLPLEGQLPNFRERGGYCLIETPYSQGVQLLAFPLSNPSQQLSLKLPGANQITARIHGHILVVCDSTGRVLVADLQARDWLAQFYL